MSTFMKIRAVALLLGTVALGGCAEWENHMQSVLPPPEPAYAGKQIVVAPQRSGHAVVFSRTASAVSADEQKALADFLSNSGIAEGSVVMVEQAPAGSRRVARLRVANVTNWLRRHGYQTEPFAVTPAEDGVVHLQVEKLVAVAPNCPNWDIHPYFEFGANAYPNLGCADRTNLAAMIVDPRDLVDGHTPGLPTGQANLNGEIRYRTGEVTPLTDAEAAVGN
jgi:pilus assembly protein CpaD